MPLEEQEILALVAKKTAGQIRTQSPDWYRLKNDIITSTNVPAILEYSPYTSKEEMFQRKVHKTSTLSEHPAVLWGIKYESMARTLCSGRLGHFIHETGLKVHGCEEWNFLGATPDGLGIDKEGAPFLVEFKCLATRAITHQVPLDYWVQVQIAMEVWDIDRCLYSENIFKEYTTEEAWRADDSVTAECKGFWSGLKVWWSLVEHWDVWIERRRDWWALVAPVVRAFQEEVVAARITLANGGEMVKCKRQGSEAPYHYRDIDWHQCIRGTQLTAWLRRDPLIDWLNIYGVGKGFAPDPASELAMSDYVFDQTAQFRDLLINYLKEKANELGLGARDVGEYPELKAVKDPLLIHYNFHSVGTVNRTVEAIRGKVPLIFNGLLFHATTGVFGRADLIVREDLLGQLFPEAVLGVEEGSKDLWVAVNFKYAILDLGADGQRLLSTQKQNEYQMQLLVLNEALCQIQDRQGTCAYLVSRKLRSKRFKGTPVSSTKATPKGKKRSREEASAEEEADIPKGERGLLSTNCLRNLIRIVVDRPELQQELVRAVGWVRRVRQEGASWHPIEKPMLELRPNMKNHQDSPWRQAKCTIAEQLGECTQIMNIGYQCRQELINQFGLSRWKDLRLSHLQAAGVREADLVTKILAINNPEVPGELTEMEGGYGYGVLERPLDLSECSMESFEGGHSRIALFMDFETVTDLYDTFGQMPETDGHELVYLIGCLEYDQVSGACQYHHFLVEALNPGAEQEMFKKFLRYLQELQERLGGVGPGEEPIHLYHWTAAEITHLGKIAARHNLRLPETIKTVDLYKLFRTNRIVIEGSFCFALKNVAKAWYQHGLIASTWKDGMNGAQASVGAWRAMEEAVLAEKALPESSIIPQLVEYNYNDCKVLQEMLVTLQARLGQRRKMMRPS